MRQRGDTSWASDLNAFRMCQDGAALETALARVTSRCSRNRFANAAGPNENDAEWADALRIFPKNHAVKAYNDAQLPAHPGEHVLAVVITAACTWTLDWTDRPSILLYRDKTDADVCLCAEQSTQSTS